MSEEIKVNYTNTSVKSDTVLVTTYEEIAKMHAIGIVGALQAHGIFVNPLGLHELAKAAMNDMKKADSINKSVKQFDSLTIPDLNI